MPSQTTLAISLFFHFSATVVWIGGLLVMVLLVWPEARRTLEDSPALYSLLKRLRVRFMPISNLCLVVLIFTGITQMTRDPNYDGLLTFSNTWTRVMLIKHLVIICMATAGLALQYAVIPSLERASLLVERAKGETATQATIEYARLRRREVRLTWLMAALGISVLALSAWAGSL